MENHSQMTRTRRDWLLILLLTLVPLTCTWAFLPSRHEVGPSAAAEFALSTHLVDPADTTDTTTSQSPATPQVIGYIDKDPSIPGIPTDSLYPKPPRDSIPFKPLDRRGPVGTPSGIVSVSATGAATYNLDIQVPDGGGLTPHLSLTYDSQKGGYGLAGYGIGITGLSAITRGGCDLFHDGAQRGVTYTDADNLFLDPQTRTYVEETGGANVLFVKEDGTLVVPQSHTDSILPSITRRSLVQVAEDLGMTVDQRPVEWAEVKSGKFSECGMCGTAAVISPVGEIDNKVYGADETVTFPAGYTEIGPVMKKLRETLTGIQSGAVEDKHGWVYTVA